MKTKNYLLQVLFVSFLVMLNSCSNETNEIKSNKNIQSSPSECCSVSCKRGSCTSYSSPCSCTCSIWGMPECGSTASQIDDKEWLIHNKVSIEANDEQINSQEDFIKYIDLKISLMEDDNLKSSLTNAKSILFKINQLFTKNKLNISNEEDIIQYYKYVDELNKIADSLPLKIQEEIIDEK